MSDLIDFVEKLVVPHEKTASGLELEAFDALLAQADEEEKVAYGMMGGGSDDWLSRFQHTPLYEKAIALKEKDLALEKRRMEERQRREKAYRHDDSTWNEQDKLCLEKDKLTLELHKWRASQEAKTKLKMAAGLKVAGNGDPLREKMKRLGQTKKAAGSHDLHKKLYGQRAGSSPIKKAELVEYTGHVNNGEPQAPEWPRAALGVDSANRRVTPEEAKGQSSVRSPDIQHVEPHSDGSDFSKKVSSLVVKLAGMNLATTPRVADLLKDPRVAEAAKKLGKPKPPPDKSIYMPIAELLKGASLKIAFKPGQILTGGLLKAPARGFGGIARAAGKAVPPPTPAAALAKKRGPLAAANEALVARYGAGRVPAHLVTV
jgi:hypothetical protein